MSKHGPSKFQQHVLDVVATQLEVKPQTVAEIAVATKVNYYSVRNAIQTLFNDGAVAPVNANVHRNVKYRLLDENGPNRIIPTITSVNGSGKLHELMRLRNNPRNRAAEAVINLPRQITLLMRIAERIANEGAPQDKRLEALKKEMEGDVAALENIIDIFKQVLENPRNWNPEVLAKFVNDAEYDPALTEESYRHYFEA